MATYSETFLCTAIPSGVDGTKLRLAVVVAPRLGSDETAQAPLDNWPDVRDWPAVSPAWEVTIKQGGTEVKLPATEVKPQPYDEAAWRSLFSPTMPVTPYLPEDPSPAPIFSYPAHKVIEGAKALHLKALTTSRTSFPALAELQRDATFLQLKRAARQAFANRIARSQWDGPKPDSERSLAEAFAMADVFHGERPGSEFAGVTPVLTSIAPPAANPGSDVTLKGEHFQSGAVVMFSAASWSADATNVAVKADGKELTCTTPSGRIGEVQVRVRVGDLISNALSFTFLEKPK